MPYDGVCASIRNFISVGKFVEHYYMLVNLCLGPVFPLYCMIVIYVRLVDGLKYSRTYIEFFYLYCIVQITISNLWPASFKKVLRTWDSHRLCDSSKQWKSSFTGRCEYYKGAKLVVPKPSRSQMLPFLRGKLQL